jgi:Nickel responsive protein SCO4226-like
MGASMSDVFLQRFFDPPLTDEAFDAMSRDSLSCFDLHRVAWQQSLLSADGKRLICWFRAPDAESMRLALRQAGEHTAIPWSGTVHDSPATDAPPAHAANVVVERSFETPVTLEAIQAIEDAGAACLSARDVTFVRTLFSRDRKRMVCLYCAPDAESVREAQRLAGLPLDAVWRFRLKT